MKEDCHVCGVTYRTEELPDSCPYERTCPECIEEDIAESIRNNEIG